MGCPCSHHLAPSLGCPQEYLDFRKERSRMLLSRRNQLLLEFSFWNEPLPRKGPNIYELRTYKLKVRHEVFQWDAGIPGMALQPRGSQGSAAHAGVCKAACGPVGDWGHLCSGCELALGGGRRWYLGCNCLTLLFISSVCSQGP